MSYHVVQNGVAGAHGRIIRSDGTVVMNDGPSNVKGKTVNICLGRGVAGSHGTYVEAPRTSVVAAQEFEDYIEVLFEQQTRFKNMGDFIVYMLEHPAEMRSQIDTLKLKN